MTKPTGLFSDVANLILGAQKNSTKKQHRQGAEKGTAKVLSLSDGWVVTLPEAIPDVWLGLVEPMPSQADYTYKVSWPNVARLYSEHQSTALSSDLAHFLNVPDVSKQCTVNDNNYADDSDTDGFDGDLDEGEGIADLPSDGQSEWDNFGVWMRQFLPELDSVGSLKVRVVLEGQNINVYRTIEQNSQTIDDTVDRGWIFPHKALAHVAMPLWLWQLDHGLETIRHLLSHESTRQQAFGLLQQIQQQADWVTSEHTLLLDAPQVEGMRYVSLPSWQVAVRPSTVGNTADVLPYSDELAELLGLSEAGLIESIQHALNDWDNTSTLTLRNPSHHDTIYALVMLTEQQQQAFVALKRSLHRKSLREIKDFVYFPDDTVHDENFQQVFQLDLSEFGPRVYGIGPIPYLHNPFGVMAGKSLTDRMNIDELVNPEGDHESSKKEAPKKPEIVPAPDGNGCAVKVYPPNSINGETSEPVHVDIDDAKQFVNRIEEELKKGSDLRQLDPNDLILPTIDGEDWELPPVESVLRPLVADLKRTLNKPLPNEFGGLSGEPSEKNMALLVEMEYDEKQREVPLDYMEQHAQTIEGWLTQIPGLKSNITLFPYQQDGVRWLLHAFMRGCNGVLFADDMGLGKTLQSLCFLSILMNHAWKEFSPDGYDPDAFINKERTTNPILVVVPPVLIQNFKDQANDFFENADDQFNMLLLHGDCGTPPRSLYKEGLSPQNTKGKESDSSVFRIPAAEFQKYRIVVTTYDCIEAHQFSFARVKWSVMLCDEVQKAKNIRSKISHALKAIASHTAFDIMMTGTPVENDMSELYNIMDIANPGLLGKSPKEFTEAFGVLLGREPKSEHETPENMMEILKGEKFLRFGDIKKGYMLGRLKTDVGQGLPALYDDDVIQTEVSRLDYEKVKERCHHPLQLLQSLKLYGMHPQYADGQPKLGYELEWVERSPRFFDVLNKLDKIKARGEKALLFCEYHLMQESLQKAINQRFALPDELKAVNSQLRRKKQVIDQFKYHTGFCALVLSPKCAGMGLNLQEANHVFHVSRWWNPAIEDQATCRAYRTGQQNDVHVYYCISVLSDGNEGEMTFDQALHELLTEKRKKRSDLLSLEYATNIREHDVADKMGDKLNWCIEHIDELGQGQRKGHSFELWVKEQFEKEGFHTEKPTPDRGIDLQVKPKGGGDWIAIQIKHSHNPNAKSDWGKVQRFPMDVQQTGQINKGLYFTNQTMIDAHRENLEQYEANHGQLSLGVVSRSELKQYLNKQVTLTHLVSRL